MATDGQSLEKLVEVLENIDLPGTEIKTRDKIYDKVAKESREVDVSVRFRKGSHKFLMIFECRDRHRKNGPDWIEQIIQKTRDLGANKVIAVSSSGFTKGAIEKAKQYDINLRTVEEITAQEIFNWFMVKNISGLRYLHDIKQIHLVPKNANTETDNQKLNDFFNKHRASLGKDRKFINQKGNLSLQSPNDLLFTCDRDTLFSDVICGGPIVPKVIEMYPNEEDSDFQIVVDKDEISVDHFVFITLFQIMEIKSDILSVKRYQFDGKTLAQIVEFEDYDFPEGKRSIECVLRCSEVGNHLILFKLGESKKK